MGSLFKDGGLTIPNSQLQTAGGPSFVGSPSQVLSKANAGLPSADAMMGPDVLNPNQQAPKLPFIGQPSFRDAVTAGAQPGGVNALSPGLNKAGKLVTLLSSGLQGALAGRAAQEQAAVQSGGRRAGGVGMAMEAGYNLPAQRQATQQQLAQQRAQTALTEQQAQEINVPGYGNMPAGLAKVLFPSLIKGQTATTVQGMKGQTAQAIEQSREQSQEKIHRFIPVPGVGLFDAQTKNLVPDTGQGITVTPEIAADHSLPQEFVGKPMKLSDFNSMMRFENQQLTTVQGEAGPALVNKKTKQVTNLGLGNPGMGKPLQVGDVNNPGNTTFTTGAQAVASGAPGPQSASVAVPKAAAKAEVPTKIGDQKVAFTTMIQHADLMRRAAKALNNGDMQTLSGLENAFKNEFGWSGPITASAIADAYKGEVSNVINKGHITDTGNEKIAHTLDPTKQNYATVDSVLSAYQSLAQSKMNMLNQQTKNAVNQSQPKKNGTTPAADPFAQFGGKSR